MFYRVLESFDVAEPKSRGMSPRCLVSLRIARRTVHVGNILAVTIPAKLTSYACLHPKLESNSPIPK